MGTALHATVYLSLYQIWAFRLSDYLVSNLRVSDTLNLECSLRKLDKLGRRRVKLVAG